MGAYNLGGGGPFWNGIPLIGTQPDISGISLFVDSRGGSDDNTGKSWNQAFKTLEKAIYLSNINIADIKNASRRNTIFVAGDPITTNLTTFPNKTDIVGCGSYNMRSQVCIVGKHVPSTGQETRFYNVYFKGNESQETMLLLTISNPGFEAHGCTFESMGGMSDSVIQNNGAAYFVLDHCYFMGFAILAMISFGSGDLRRAMIYRCNVMTTSNNGIFMNTSGSASQGASIESSLVFSRLQCIFDGSSKWRVINCRLTSTNVKGTGGNGIVACNSSLAQGNCISGSDLNNALFPAQGTL